MERKFNDLYLPLTVFFGGSGGMIRYEYFTSKISCKARKSR